MRLGWKAGRWTGVAAMGGLLWAGAAGMAQTAPPAKTLAESLLPASSGAPLVATPAGFLLRGKPFQIHSGEMEYARIPRADWRDRLQKARALGLNAITMYVFWNLHEPRPGVYDFSGQNDVAEFVREAQAEGLYVILRPGPYVCAEWDLGGYPAWLLRDPAMQLRSLQPAYFQQAARWMMRLGQELAPLQASRGGPILAVQVENEYGSFGEDHAYMRAMYRLVQQAGFTSSLLYTADGADVLEKGSLPGVLAAVDFGTGDAARSLALLRKQRPTQPVYVAEYWDGWFDHWGEAHQTTDSAVQEREIGAMLAEGDSLSLYMVEGGTSFGWRNGANTQNGRYQPDVSSYDYDAPLDESGRPRPKFFRVRDLLATANRHVAPAMPVTPPMMTLPAMTLDGGVSLWDTLPAPVRRQRPPTMEDVGQSYGYILYRTTVEGEGPAELAINTLHDYARIYLDGVLAAVLDRRTGVTSTTLGLHGHQRLDVLVENSGRVNFGPQLLHGRAGIEGEVRLRGEAVQGWEVFPLPMDSPPAAGHGTACTGPCFSSATFEVQMPGDTYLDTRQLGKGVIWVNGHLLGRFWRVGPAGYLYLPGAWLHAGENRITVFDLDGVDGRQVQGVAEQIEFAPRPERSGPSPVALQDAAPAK